MSRILTARPAAEVAAVSTVASHVPRIAGALEGLQWTAKGQAEAPTRTRTQCMGVAVAQACPAIALPVPEIVAFDLNALQPARILFM